MIEKHLYWVGPRNSDISSCKRDFYGSITSFGDGASLWCGSDRNYAYCLASGRRRNHNVNDEAENAFIFSKIEEIISRDRGARFLFYDPNVVYSIYSAPDQEGKRRPLVSLNTNGQFLCLNSPAVSELANNKRCFASLLSGKGVPLLQHKDNVHSSDGDYNSLLRTFELDRSRHPRFIFQAPISSGGNGTFIVSEETDESVIRKLKKDERFLVSVYEERNIPINIHAIIFKDHIILSPGSVQIIREGADNCGEHRLLYRGADFLAYQKLPKEVIRQFESAVIKACEIYREEGYLGVCGIDGIVCDDQVYLLEMNNRFQASTALINRALDMCSLASMQEMNISAFCGEWDDDYLALHDVTVPFSNFSFEATDNIAKMHAEHIYNVATALLATKAQNQEIDPPGHVVDLEDDGLSWEQDMDDLAYLYRIVFNKSITSVGPEGTMYLNENIVEPNKKDWYDHLDISINQGVFSYTSPKETRDYCLHLKIALLIQGVRFTKEAYEYRLMTGGIRTATNNAVDLRINFPNRKYLIINSPVLVDFVEFSPFSIRLEGDHMILCYYKSELTKVTIPIEDPISYEIKDGVSMPRETLSSTPEHRVLYEDIAFLSTDRLRVHVTNFCIYKHLDMGCKFCNIKPSVDLLDLADIEEVVERYCDEADRIGLTHFLVGGQTAAADDERLIDVIRIVRKHSPSADIYAMVVPHAPETIRKMYDAGLTQLSCNIEIFDDTLALQYMPGKRRIPKDAYLRCLKYATTLLGKQGNVRTMVIVGLEPEKSLIDGITEFVACGIQPILSIFRPLPHTSMADMQAPPMTKLAKLYDKLQAICKKNGLLLGPNCVNCQNNTLALPAWLETAPINEP